MADLNFDCPECAHDLIVDDQAAGMVVACPECGTQIRVPSPKATPSAAETADLAEESPLLPENVLNHEPEQLLESPEMTVSEMREYQVVSVLAQITDVKEIRANVVAAILNEQARERWLLRTATVVSTCDEKGKPQQDLLLFMERPI